MTHMYLAELNITNFRKLRDAKLQFQPGLNVLVGPNNVGKSAVVDALRTLLAGHEEPYPASMSRIVTDHPQESQRATLTSTSSSADSVMTMRQTSFLP